MRTMDTIMKKRIVLIAILVVVVLIGVIAWTSRYSARAGYIFYEVGRQQGFELSDAQQALESQGYSVEVDASPVPPENPYLRTTDPSDGDVTYIRLSILEGSNMIEIQAYRDIQIPPAEVVEDPTTLQSKHEQLAEGDVRELLAIVGLPDTGTFTFGMGSDSMDYIVPTTVFYLLIFAHLPAVIILILYTLTYKEKEKLPLE